MAGNNVNTMERVVNKSHLQSETWFKQFLYHKDLCQIEQNVNFLQHIQPSAFLLCFCVFSEFLEFQYFSEKSDLFAHD